MSTVIDAKFEEHAPLAVRDAQPIAAPQLLDALRPAERVALMTEIADVVKDVIEKQKWFQQIGPKKHILIQGWTFIGGLGGCSAKTTHTEKIDGGFKAHAEVVRVDSGVVVGEADQVCMSAEKNWKSKDDYALIGMASTRACSRALSSVFRHVVELAGYSATPAEEMTQDAKPFQDAPSGQQTASEPILASAEQVAEIAAQLRLAGVRGTTVGGWLVAHGIVADGKEATVAEYEEAMTLLDAYGPISAVAQPTTAPGRVDTSGGGEGAATAPDDDADLRRKKACCVAIHRDFGKAYPDPKVCDRQRKAQMKLRGIPSLKYETLGDVSLERLEDLAKYASLIAQDPDPAPPPRGTAAEDANARAEMDRLADEAREAVAAGRLL